MILPKKTIALISNTAMAQRHPGLQLDKWSMPGDQKAQRDALENVCKAAKDEEYLRRLLHRRRSLLNSDGVKMWSCRTAGPFTLHLARASALENAGICLHPLYGFVYLPGSGLKGMARAYAETVWLASLPETERVAAWRQIEAVFGWAPGCDRIRDANGRPIEKPWKPKDVPKHGEADASSSGQIVFHDAWPETWPRLIVDIVNNHHPKYYQGNDDRDPPGDWESPVPVYFLAVPPGQTFSFALSKRRSDTEGELLNLAKKWLLGALVHEGAGAKTAAGYGSFEPINEPVVKVKSAAREVFECTLELVTPAFLAGANQNADDCDLRSATLRGLLRWWWRTMHAGYVDVRTLRDMEAAIWGDTNTGGAVRIRISDVDKSTKPVVIPVPGKMITKDKKNRDVLRVDVDFARQHGFHRPADFKTTQGILYLAFGTDEMPAGKLEKRHRRFCVIPGSKWKVNVSARNANWRSESSERTATELAANWVARQAHAALWLLCHFGGVGAKNRNGFGSLRGVEGFSLNEVLDAAGQLRALCGVSESRQDLTVPALENLLPPVEVRTPWRDPWFAIDQLGFSVQDYAQKLKRDCSKESLGLPRKIGISDKDGSKEKASRRESDAQSQSEVVWLGQSHRFRGDRPAKDMRHASPVHLSFTRENDGVLVIRATAFPSDALPDLETSRHVLGGLLEHLRLDLQNRAQADPGPQRASEPEMNVTVSVRDAPSNTVRVRVIGPHDKNPSWYWVQEEGKSKGLVKYGPLPAPLPEADATIVVYPTNNNPQSPEYRWDRPSPGPERKSTGGRTPHKRGKR